MTRAIRFYEHGGPEVLKLEDVDLGAPGPDQVLIRQTAIGVNYRDIYRRTGGHPVQGFPAALGVEGAGIIEAMGAAVEGFALGQHVVALGDDGAYAEARLAPAARTLVLPEGVDARTAAAMMVKGMTASYLLRKTCAVKPGDTVLVHAAAGGVGLILCQWAKAIGARVIGTVGTEEKAALAAAHGCDHPIVYACEDFAARVRDITDGRGVRAVYDSVGRDTFEGSLASLATRGVLAQYGEASGDPPLVDPRRLGPLGSVYLTHPSLPHYTRTRTDLLDLAQSLFEVVRTGLVKIRIGHIYPLAQAARAHADMAARNTTGSIILIP